MIVSYLRSERNTVFLGATGFLGALLLFTVPSGDSDIFQYVPIVRGHVLGAQRIGRLSQSRGKAR
jgi:hypothetical protein